MTAQSHTLLTINNDCLDHIFRYFTLDELMEISGKLHFHIDDAIERQLHRFRHFEFTMRFPPNYNANQLQSIGRHLESLNINVGYTIETEKLLSLLLPLIVGAAEAGRLRALKIQHAYITANYGSILLRVAPLLHELDFSISDGLDRNLLLLLLRTATNLKMLALTNLDAANVDQTLFGHLHYLKINWLVGTKLLDVALLSQLYPNLSIVVYQISRVDAYGPPYVGKQPYFH